MKNAPGQEIQKISSSPQAFLLWDSLIYICQLKIPNISSVFVFVPFGTRNVHERNVDLQLGKLFTIFDDRFSVTAWGPHNYPFPPFSFRIGLFDILKMLRKCAWKQNAFGKGFTFYRIGTIICQRTVWFTIVSLLFQQCHHFVQFKSSRVL